MRNNSTPVFLYPRSSSGHVHDAVTALSAELSAHGYRLLPDRFVNLSDQLREAALSVFLMDNVYEETLDQLVRTALMSSKPSVIWCSPESREAVPRQLGLIRYLEQFDSPTKTFLDETISVGKLKEEVLTLLGPKTIGIHDRPGKPRIFLVYNSRDHGERVNAGQIDYHYQGEFHFDHPDDPTQHTARLASSDGVLLVWGNSDEAWCAMEFESMLQVSRRALARGLCLFDPAHPKKGIAEQIRNQTSEIHILEQFGNFDPSRMESFFNPIRRASATGAQ
jgi:hypothetical protein